MRLFTSSSSALQPMLGGVVSTARRRRCAGGWVGRAMVLLRGLLRERVLHCTLLAAALLVVTASVRVPHDAGIYRYRHTAIKLAWREEADWVLAGDSRVQCGLSPAAMEAQVDGARVLDFGFASAQFTEAYLDAVERVIDPRSEQPTIVLGVTPLSLLGAERGGFERACEEAAEQSLVSLMAGQALMHLQPARLDSLWRECSGASRRRVITTRHANGWNAYAPPQTREPAVQAVAETFANKDVSVARQDALLRRVQNWTGRGIRVVGFRPPTCAEMVAAEEAAGFDEQGFAEAFRGAGGVWLDVDPLAYESSDGSHIYPAAAERLAADIASALSGRATSEITSVTNSRTPR